MLMIVKQSMSDIEKLEQVSAPENVADHSDEEVDGDRVPLLIDGKMKNVPRIVQEELEVDIPVHYQVMGSDHPFEADDTDIHIQCGRVRKIEGLEKCKKLKSLRLIANLVDKLENLEPVPDLEHLEVYQSCLTKIENISFLTKLTVLDLSFNEIRRIENLEPLVNLEKLYLSANKITKIEGLDNLKKLRMLELGSNRIRTLEGLPQLPELEELWLGKNKLISMTLPFPMPKLEYISMQSNRLEEWDVSLLSSLASTLVHFQVSHNKLPSLPDTFHTVMPRLNVLDMAGNIMQELPDLSLFPNLEDLWMNDNLIANPNALDRLKSAAPSLSVVYLERNPVQMRLGVLYKQTILENVKGIKQLDAVPLNVTVNVDQGRRIAAEALMKSLLAKQLTSNTGERNVTEEQQQVADATKEKTTQMAKQMGMRVPAGMEFLALDEETIKTLKVLAAPNKPILKK
eukprot:GDKJ01056863.1.p1 GENE.GDKJ01056863.1~~GDKJ01056863.1.p1  ORF type:complete len:457 (-),score=122.47 GDKJ01056863.1:61-1431(-)